MSELNGFRVMVTAAGGRVGQAVATRLADLGGATGAHR